MASEARDIAGNNGDGRKLHIGEKVEVLRSEEHYHESWFIGVVTDCLNCSRVVELTDLMYNTVYSRIVVSIPISEAVQGISSKVEDSYIGRIRPLPPRHNLAESELNFGLCVDVFIKDSWREGVVVGRNKNSTKKLIFFPGTSDDVLVPASKIRPTQVWNEVSGHWSHRGRWIFLEIIRSYKQKKFSLLEIQEMWLHLKGTTVYCEKIKNWYYGSKLTWNELVSDAIHWMNSAVSSLSAAQSSSYAPPLDGHLEQERAGSSSEAGAPCLASTSHTCNCCTTALNRHKAARTVCCGKRKLAEHHILVSAQRLLRRRGGCISAVESSEEIKGAYEHQEDERLLNCDGDNEILLSGADDVKVGRAKKKAKKRLAPKTWKPVTLKGEYCHDLSKLSGFSHEEFQNHSVNKLLKLACTGIKKVKLRKHLVSVGWRIEYIFDNTTKFRYISPEQSTYYSLIKVIQYLLRDKTYVRGMVGDRTNSIDINNELNVIPCAKADFVPSKHDTLMHPMDVEISPAQQTAEQHHFISDSFELMGHKIMQSSFTELIEKNAQPPGSCLTTIDETLDSKENNTYENTKSSHLEDGVLKAYMNLIDLLKINPKFSSAIVKELRSKTKAYLLEKGWKLWLYTKKVKPELRYTSPNGRTYVSLNSACKGYWKELHGECTGKMPLEGIDDNKSLYCVSFDSAISTLNKEKIYELSCNSGLMTAVNQKPLARQKEESHQGYLFSSNLFFSDDFDSKEQIVKRKELKRRKVTFPNTCLTLDKQSQSHASLHYCDQKHAVKMGAFDSSSGYKPTRGSLSSRVLRSGKRSRWAMVLSSKDQVAKSVLSWLIDKDIILPRQKVAFVRQTDSLIMKVGWITYDGIKCRCCQNVFPISQFGAHAGSRNSRPSASMILQDGRSLLDCQKQAMSSFKPNGLQPARLRSDYSDYEADDLCTVCHDGGLIMLCDLCPSAFHPACIGLEDVPDGKWFCPSCRCGICSLNEFNCDTENFTENSGIICDQCERQYHVGCLQNQGLILNECPTGTWTCSKACFKIIQHLRLLLGKSNPTSAKGLRWTLLRSSSEDDGKLDVDAIVENSGMLHIALDVLHECFEAMVEARTQSDLATDIIFNKTSELNRLNFWGFYTMLLMSGDELISVANFRIFGKKLAEMPFICTRVKFRRQGMCHLLMAELQKMLCSLGVERLLLPAVPELLKTWISSFGFSKVSCSERLGLLEHPILTFQGTTLCHKFLVS